MPSPHPPTPAAPSRPRLRRVLLIVDIVESVRLMREYEDDMVERWPAFVRLVRSGLLPRHRGTLVKSLGDGMLLGFEEAADAVAAALALQRELRPFNAGRPAEQVIHLRSGLHVGEVICEDFDWFGAAVNIAARLAGLALPDQIVASVDVRDACAPGLDAEFDDLGECFLKHEPRPVRCYALRSPDPQEWSPAPPAAGPEGHLQPKLAVVPFSAEHVHAGAAGALGDALADALISAFSRRRDWKVLARASTVAFRGRQDDLVALRRVLDATYAVQGRYRLHAGRAEVEVGLYDVRRQALLWQAGFSVRPEELFAGEALFVDEVLAAVVQALAVHEQRCAHLLPVPTLDDYALYAGGVSLMNRLSIDDFLRARELFGQLQERLPRAAAPPAILARWYILYVAQGWSTDRERHAQAAHAAAQRALQLEPDHAFALCVDGLRSMHGESDLAQAARRFDAALQADPHEPAAWTWKAGLHAYRDEADAAVEAAEQAIALSPLDPARFSMDAYHALALLVAGRYETCIEVCQASLRRNAGLGASYRTLAQAQALAGRVEEARQSMQRLLVAEPRSTVARYRQVYPGRHAAHMERLVEALRLAGLPE